MPASRHPCPRFPPEPSAATRGNPKRPLWIPAFCADAPLLLAKLRSGMSGFSLSESAGYMQRCEAVASWKLPGSILFFKSHCVLELGLRPAVCSTGWTRKGPSETTCAHLLFRFRRLEVAGFSGAPTACSRSSSASDWTSFRGRCGQARRSCRSQIRAPAGRWSRTYIPLRFLPRFGRSHLR